MKGSQKKERKAENLYFSHEQEVGSFSTPFCLSSGTSAADTQTAFATNFVLHCGPLLLEIWSEFRIEDVVLSPNFPLHQELLYLDTSIKSYAPCKLVASLLRLSRIVGVLHFRTQI